MGFTPSTKKSDLWEGNNKWLSIADLKSKYIYETTKHISDDATKNKKIIPKDILIMSFKLTLGKLGILKEDMYTNEAICNFTLFIPMETEYMYYHINSLNIEKYGAIAAKGITLNKDLLNPIPIKTISLDLQNEIMNIFKCLDDK